MELSAQDNLRLNVLLTRDLRAIRINESSMQLHALYVGGEARIQLNPDCDDRVYLKKVRELLSSHVLGSPGGYPVFLQRWSRTGQLKSKAVSSLLCLGEPEAVAAAAHSEGISVDIAGLIWWCQPTTEIARQLLSSHIVSISPLGRELIIFLLEFLPFESESDEIIYSVKHLLDSSLLTREEEQILWTRSKRKVTYLIGFLHARSDSLPVQCSATDDYQTLNCRLSELKEFEQIWLRQLGKVLSPAGQTFLKMFHLSLHRIADQESVVSLFDALQKFMRLDRVHEGYARTTMEIRKNVSLLAFEHNNLIEKLLPDIPAIEKMFHSVCFLSMVGEPLLIPVLSRSTAVGSVLRKQLSSVFDELEKELQALGVESAS